MNMGVDSYNITQVQQGPGGSASTPHAGDTSPPAITNQASKRATESY